MQFTMRVNRIKRGELVVAMATIYSISIPKGRIRLQSIECHESLLLLTLGHVLSLNPFQIEPPISDASDIGDATQNLSDTSLIYTPICLI